MKSQNKSAVMKKTKKGGHLILKEISKPKKKKKKHVQIILQQYDIQDADDVKIRRIIKDWNKKEENQED